MPILLTIAFFPAMESPFAIGHKALVFRNLLRGQNRFDAINLFFLDLHHFGTHAVPDCFGFGFRLIENGLQLIDLRGGQMHSGFHLREILLPYVARRGLSGHDRFAIVAVPKSSHSNAASEQAEGEENCNPLITLH